MCCKWCCNCLFCDIWVLARSCYMNCAAVLQQALLAECCVCYFWTVMSCVTHSHSVCVFSAHTLSQIGSGRAEPRLGSNLLSGAQRILEAHPSPFDTCSLTLRHTPFLNPCALSYPVVIQPQYSTAEWWWMYMWALGGETITATMNVMHMLFAIFLYVNMCEWVCVCSGCYWASVLALHLWPLSFPQPDAMLCYRTWAHTGNRATHIHICQKWSRLPLKGPDAHSWPPSRQPKLHTEAQRACFFLLLLFLPDVAAHIQPLNVYWAPVCRANGGAALTMSSWEPLQSFHCCVTVPWKIISAPNSFLSSHLSLQEALQLSPPVSLACVRGSQPLLCQWACPSRVCQWLT